ncbi:hypothetical protein [Nocardioides xinjiangensis]|uniref:hypothetical protein n=1 Tax=Nocardioides xinjiangensis TaxID=2817376 RepID=UPI001B300C27|nr:MULTISPECIES: hypothetical protein [unclassified Nocardioides]
MLKALVAAVGALGLLAALGLGAVLWADPAEGDPFETPDATSADLEDVAGHRVFFGHKSVGYNILDALPRLYEERGVAAPKVVESREAPLEPAIVHTPIGENGHPLEKIAEFDRIMRDGMADAVDVAIVKLCYVDFREGRVDVEEVFTAYRDTLAGLSRDYPGTSFVAATSPLTTERGPLGKVKAALGRGDTLGPEHNVVRERFNALMRAEYTEPGTLFDIAAIQSTDASGARVSYERDGEHYYAMEQAYASDPGHLNPDGAEVAASAFVAVLADALA